MIFKQLEPLGFVCYSVTVALPMSANPVTLAYIYLRAVNIYFRTGSNSRLIPCWRAGFEILSQFF